jgi:hypothetical protein
MPAGRIVLAAGTDSKGRIVRRPKNYYSSRRSMPKVSNKVKQYCKRLISKKKENRQLITTHLNQSLNTVISGSAPTSFINLLPQPIRNANDDGRIGNTITVKEGIIKGHVNLLPFNSVSNPIVAPLYVKMWVVSCKKNNTDALVDTGIAANFFDGNSASLGFQQNMLDLHLPNCKEWWTVHYTKIIKLGLGSGTNTYLSTQVSVNDNSSFTAPFYFNWGRKVRGSLKYLDSAAAPTNRNLWLIFTAVAADGTSTTITGAEYHAVNKTQFEC